MSAAPRFLSAAGAAVAALAVGSGAALLAAAAPTPASYGCVPPSSNSSSGGSSTGLDSLTVQLDYADLIGTKLTGSTYGTAMRAFLGIPYAQPPVGDLRFAAPKQIASHLGTVNTTAFGANCMQSTTPFSVLPDGEPDLVISEDCLFVNVWTPTAVSESPLPVMVWVYGGNYNSGGTSMSAYNGANLIDKAVDIDEPVIVVSMNYRTGAFGFLASPEIFEAGDSNAGMKDQQLAFQ
ncbi:hypothetical protein HK405_012131, partial [Cladochytrium tenue]